MILTDPRRSFILLVLLSLPAAFVFAQPLPDTCNTAFSQGIRDNYQLLSERQQFEMYQSRLCTAKYDRYETFRTAVEGLNLSIPLAEGLLGLGGSSDQKAASFKESYSKFCTSSYFTSEYRDRYQSYISQISSALLTNWSTCINSHLNTWLLARGVFAEVSPFGSFNAFLATVRVRTPDVGNVVIKSIAPDDQVRCSRAGQPVIPGTTQIDSLEFTLTCHKDPSLEVPFVVETNKGQTQLINVPAGTSKILELRDQIDAIRTQLVQARAEGAASTDKVRSDLTAQVTNLNSIVASIATWKNCEWRDVGYDKSHGRDTSGWCQDGWYLTGFDLDSVGGGTYVQVGKARCCKP